MTLLERLKDEFPALNEYTLLRMIEEAKEEVRNAEEKENTRPFKKVYPKRD